MSDTVVETPRLRVRGWRDADVDPMVDVFADPQTVRYVGKGYQRGFSRDQTLAMIARLRDRCEKTGIGIWAVELKETQTTIGECGLHPAADSGDTEIAYVFSPSARGFGYATEAASAVLGYAFATLDLPRVLAFVHPGNAQSIAVVHRLGMRFDRLVRTFHADVLRYVAVR